MKQKLANKAFKYVWKLFMKYGTAIWREAKYILKKAIKKLLRKSACTVIESFILRYAVEPLMKYGLKQAEQGGISKDDFLEGLVY